MTLKATRSVLFNKSVCQIAVILFCTQLITCHGITIREFPETLSSNDTQSRNKSRTKRGQIPSSVPAPVTVLKDYPVGTRDLETGGRAPNENTWNVFRLEYDLKYSVYLLKLVPHNVVAALQEVDENLIHGYWLGTAKSEEESVKVDGSNKRKPKKNVLKVPVDDAKFIFTAEFQGCSVYARVNSTDRFVEFFHYNRPELMSIYVNKYNGSPINKISSNFLDLHGNGIKFNNDVRLNPKKLYNRAGEIHAIDGVIVLKEALFFRDEDNGEKIEIKTINNKSVDSLIRLNSEQVKHENALKAKYDVVIRWEDYIGLPANYPLLMAEEIIKRQFVTGHFYRKSSQSNWHFISQRITYTESAKRMNRDDRKIFNADNPYKCDIEIKEKAFMVLPLTKHCKSGN